MGKKIVVAAAFLLAALVPVGLQAQTVTYTLANVPQADDDDLALLITARNERLCTQLGAVGGFSCNQSQACAAALTKGYTVGGGASCSAAQARNASPSSVRIWPNASVSDRNEYILFRIASPSFADQKPFVQGWNQIRACLKWQTDNATARNTACAAHGLPNGCSLYPATCPGS